MSQVTTDVQIVDPDNSSTKLSAATTSGSVTVGTVSTSVLAANSARKEFTLSNDSNEDIYINFSGTAVMNQGHVLKAAGGAISNNTYTGAVTAICASGSKNLCVTQL